MNCLKKKMKEKERNLTQPFAFLNSGWLNYFMVSSLFLTR